MPTPPETASTPAAAPAARSRDAVLRPVVLALLALVVGTVVTLLLWNDARTQWREGELRRFEYRTGRILTELGHLFEADEIMLNSVAGLFGAGDGVNRSQWRNYFNAMD